MLGLAVLANRVALMLDGQLAGYRAPHPVLFRRVLDPRRRLAGAPGERSSGYLVTAVAITGIVRPGVVVGEVDRDSAGLVRRHRGVELCLFVHLLCDHD